MPVEKVESTKFAALKYRDFRIMWFGLILSNIGSQMQFTAINWHLYLLTGSPLALGLVGLTRFLPISVFSLISGAVADSHNRKKILLIVQTVLALLSLILAYTTIVKSVTPLIIYLITALSAIALSFDLPSRSAFIPALVHKDHLGNAISLNVIMWQIAMIAGPALAGLSIARFNIGIIYLINAISFIAIIIALLSMTTSGEVEGKSGKISFKAIVEGLVYVKSRTIIWSTMLLDFFSTFFASAVSLLPIFAQDILKVGPVGFGILSSAPAIGAVVAGLVFAQIGKIKSEGRILLSAIAVYAVATIVFGLSKIFTLSFIALLLIGVGDSISTIVRNTIRQLTTPDYIRGRMTSINMIFFMGGPQLGEFEAGLLAGFAGAPLSVVIGGAATIAVVAVVAFYIPVLRKYTT